MKCAIYGPTDTDDTDPYAWPLLAQTEEILVPANGIFWQAFAFAVADRPTLTGGKSYYLCALSDGAAGSTGMRYHTGDVAIHYYRILGEYRFLDPADCHGPWEENYICGIYCTATAIPANPLISKSLISHDIIKKAIIR